MGSISLPKLHACRIKDVCNANNVKATLRRLPNVSSFEHADTARFNFFSKQIWTPLYESSQKNGGYTIVVVPHYFDFVKLRTYIKGLNANVSFVSEYSEKKSS
mmetsp:Transcript_26502/g.40464  ORF Transcript_26502/g.40464 Transcript_26502/m.40464 type:complete len:103 (-) Transcript_26502:405-713(-)